MHGPGARGAGRPAVRLGPGAEFDLIRSFLSAASAEAPPGPGVRLGPGDDCALIAAGGFAISTDMSVEGVHFRRDWLSAREIGYRATAAALSDLAAMAARPTGVLVSLALPEADVGERAVELMEGVREAVERVGGAVLGGDVTRSPGPLVVDVTVIGECPDPVLRSGAQVGDAVWVTGELGGAALCVEHLLREEPCPAALRPRFAAPAPRIAEALWLTERRIPHAMIDLSDGLAGDSAHIAAAGGVAIVLDRAAVPIVGSARAERSEAQLLQLAVSGGEDYELCFTAAEGSMEPHVEEFEAEFGVRLTRVGTVADGEGVYWTQRDGGREPIGVGGFQHFREAL